MADVQVRIEGVEAVINALGKRNSAVDGGVSLGVRRAATLFRDTAMQYAKAGHPVGPNVITGLLSSIKMDFKEGGAQSEATVGSDAPYAAYVEYGHAQEVGRFVPAIGKKLTQSFVQPYPFMRPAVVDVFDSGNALKLIEGAIKEAMR